MNRDVWDLDWVFEQSLVTVPIKGKPTELVVTGGKPAIFDAINRATGKYEFSRDMGLQNLVTAIDPVTGKKSINPALEPAPGRKALLCPNANGARNWPTTAFDPATSILYVPMVETCTEYGFKPRDAAAIARGGVDITFANKPRPNHDGLYGRLQAVNLATGKTVWTHRQRAPMSSSLLTTAGGLLFSGSHDRFFTAYDSGNGKMLWQSRLNASPNSSPVTYSVGAAQYVAMVTGRRRPHRWRLFQPDARTVQPARRHHLVRVQAAAAPGTINREKVMVLQQALIVIKPGQNDAFEAAFAKARKLAQSRARLSWPGNPPRHRKIPTAICCWRAGRGWKTISRLPQFTRLPGMACVAGPLFRRVAANPAFRGTAVTL